MKLLITNYTFDASAQTITFGDYGSIVLESVLLITNVTDNIIIYNFADATKGGVVATNVLTLDYDTTLMDDTDDLQIWYQDETAKQPVSDGGGSLTIDGTVTINAIPAGTNNIGDVDVLSLPAIPAGTNNIGDVDVLTLPSIPAGNNNIGDVDIASIAAGDNNIGNVDVVTLPSIPAGTNNIGDVDVLTLPALVAGTAIIGKLGIDQTTPGTTNGVQINAALPAGSNAIGKLAANSGVDIGDVDVTSLPATPAGTNLIGKIAAQHSTSAMSNGTTDVTPKFAKIDRATNADGAAVVSLVSAKKIRVLTLTVVSAGTVSVKWQSSTSNSSGAGSNTDLSGLMSLVANTGMADVFSPVGLFETVAGEALKLNLNAAVQVSGYLTYLEI